MWYSCRFCLPSSENARYAIFCAFWEWTTLPSTSSNKGLKEALKDQLRLWREECKPEDQEMRGLVTKFYHCMQGLYALLRQNHMSVVYTHVMIVLAGPTGRGRARTSCRTTHYGYDYVNSYVDADLSTAQGSVASASRGYPATWSAERARARKNEQRTRGAN